MTAAVGSNDGRTPVIDVVDEGDLVRIAIHGELDLASPAELDPMVEDCIRRQRRLVVDLRGTTFIGSQGVAAILRARRQLGEELGPVTVCIGRDIQRRLFEATGVDRVVRVVDRLDGG